LTAALGIDEEIREVLILSADRSTVHLFDKSTLMRLS